MEKRYATSYVGINAVRRSSERKTGKHHGASHNWEAPASCATVCMYDSMRLLILCITLRASVAPLQFLNSPLLDSHHHSSSATILWVHGCVGSSPSSLSLGRVQTATDRTSETLSLPEVRPDGLTCCLRHVAGCLVDSFALDPLARPDGGLFNFASSHQSQQPPIYRWCILLPFTRLSLCLHFRSVLPFRPLHRALPGSGLE